MVMRLSSPVAPFVDRTFARVIFIGERLLEVPEYGWARPSDISPSLCGLSRLRLSIDALHTAPKKIGKNPSKSRQA
jgi:hypothetical protein